MLNLPSGKRWSTSTPRASTATCPRPSPRSASASAFASTPAAACPRSSPRSASAYASTAVAACPISRPPLPAPLVPTSSQDLSQSPQDLVEASPSSWSSRWRGAAPLLPDQIVSAAKRPAESSTSASSSFRSLVVSTTSSAALSAVQRPQKRPRVVMPRLRRSALESDLACPELLVDDVEMMDYWSSCGERTQSDAEEVLSAPNPWANYSLILLLDLS
ncbi:hypothetical protein QYE76_066579 [Lolium multiflorum]|uniref:Uncharacterized protein n=1 Tax=Lolium multiflorum TaxID=4521 RepID=A0AAD8SBM4_LOLMU|nr:hypothetical protein QYE76_066579 [Lolium multiflorum]